MIAAQRVFHSYAQFLVRLRAIPDIPRTLSITALPAWLSSPEIDRVIAAADEVVLQVHAVRAPTSGLFDPALARSWIDEFGARTTKPFRVALPDYGARRRPGRMTVRILRHRKRKSAAASAGGARARPSIDGHAGPGSHNCWAI